MDATTLPHQMGLYSPTRKEEGQHPGLFPKTCNALYHLIGAVIHLPASMTPYLKTGTLVCHMGVPWSHPMISIVHHQACVDPHQTFIDPHQISMAPHQILMDPH